MKFGSVCSGIEAASVAWEPLGLQAAWFSEIETFPSAVLAERWPGVPNLGDMTQLAPLIRDGLISAPAILAGGTPCQAFSVAGARKGLADERGKLIISFGELADAIDTARRARGEPPCVILWENVPGVLQSRDNAFGAFLGLLAGESCELQPPGKKWPHAGYVYGPQRTVAWRVLDAQYFGLAQRRKRVFVVASAGDAFDPGQVLFESEGLRRDTPPRRGEGETVAALTASGVGTCGADVDQSKAGHLVVDAYGGGNCSGPLEVAACLTAKGQRIDFEVETFLTHYAFQPRIARNGRGDMGDICHALNARSGETGKGDAAPCVATSTAVRRLTPVECERLQGFPDNYTLIRSKKLNRLLEDELAYVRQWFPDMDDDAAHHLAADGPRYRAIGNSMAVPVMKWLGERLLTEYEHAYL